MLGKVCLKRLRFVLYAVLFFLLTLDITNRTGDGLIATVCIWLALPLAFIAMVWWIYACVRDTVRLLRDGVAPEDAPTWAEYAVWWVQDELAEIAALDGRGKARFFLFRVGGVLLQRAGAGFDRSGFGRPRHAAAHRGADAVHHRLAAERQPQLPGSKAARPARRM
ncbi:MAG: hypothetical protein ACLUHE_06140 [Christensenellales bacterium]